MKRSRYLYGAVLAVCGALAAIPVSAAEIVTEPVKAAEVASEAEDDIASGVFDGVPWRITADHELLIGTEGEETYFDYAYDSETREWPWEEHAEDILTARFCGTVHGCGSHNSMFISLDKMTDIDVAGFDVSEVTSISSIFSGCRSLKSLDVSGWDTSDMTYMGFAFADCNSLTELNISNWNTINVKSLAWTFSGCDSLETLDVSEWDVSNVTSLEGCFAGCSSLESLDLSSWNVSNVMNLLACFSDCTNLYELDLSRWDVSSAITLRNTFSGCGNLTSLDVSEWDTSNVKDLYGTFCDCESLNQLDVSKWNVSNVMDLSELFLNCRNIKELDVSGWDVSNVSQMWSTFCGCVALRHLDLSDWDTSFADNMDSMLEFLYSLETLTLGPDVYLDEAVSLPLCWRKDGSDEILLGKELTADYDGDVMAGTYHSLDSPFNDVGDEDSYYYKPVVWAVDKKITGGTSAMFFSPYDECTRAQVVTFLWRAAGKPEPENKVNPFSDVRPGKYYSKAVLWAVENQITAGLTADTFGPEEPCTRAQVVTFLWRANNKPEDYADISGFQDVNAGKYYYDPVRWAVQAGVTQGTSTDAFSPDESCTRGQIVTFLYRVGL